MGQLIIFDYSPSSKTDEWLRFPRAQRGSKRRADGRKEQVSQHFYQHTIPTRQIAQCPTLHLCRDLPSEPLAAEVAVGHIFVRPFGNLEVRVALKAVRRSRGPRATWVCTMEKRCWAVHARSWQSYRTPPAPPNVGRAARAKSHSTTSSSLDLAQPNC